MFLIDDLLMLPLRGVMYVCKEIDKAAQEQVVGDAEEIRTELREMYMMLETGRMTEEEFDEREKELLDRLDEMESSETGP
jgi:Gas vesicle protein G